MTGRERIFMTPVEITRFTWCFHQKGRLVQSSFFIFSGEKGAKQEQKPRDEKYWYEFCYLNE
jgi:hypothetical protein